MAKVLMISYYFAPAALIAARRTLNVARQLQRFAGTVTVISTSNASYFQAAPADTGPIRILRSPTFDYHTLKFLFGYTRTRKTGRRPQKDGASSGEKLLNTFPLNVLIGEGGLFYLVFSLIQALRSGKNAGVIFSSFGPFSDHAVAFLYKKIRPHTHWVADFRDFYTHPEGRPVYFPAFHRRLLRYMLRSADTISAVSKGLAHFLHPIAGKEICLVRNAVALDNLKAPGGDLLPHFTINYTGRIYNGRYDIRPLLEALAGLIEAGKIDRTVLRLQYAGPNGNLWDAWMETSGLQTLRVNRGQVAQAEARRMQETCAVNLLMSWSGPAISGILTGKFFEYLEAGRPILLLVNGPEDAEFSEIFADLECGFQHSTSPGADAGLAGFILDLYGEWAQSGRINRPVDARKLAGYSWESQVRGLIERLPLSPHQAETSSS